jgi:hypothetical protein
LDREQKILKIGRARSRKGRHCLRTGRCGNTKGSFKIRNLKTGRFRIRKGSFKIRNKNCRVENKKYFGDRKSQK